MAQSVVQPEREIPRRKIGFEEFLRQFPGEHVEWVNGEVIRMSAVFQEHTYVSGFLFKLIDEYANIYDLGQTLHEPYVMKLGQSMPGRSPDIFFVAKANRGRLLEEYLDGPADLAVEVISPESRRRDTVTKMREYERAGVREYWLPDPKSRTTAFYVRDANGVFQPATIDSEGVYRSVVLPGFWMNVNWMWERPLPALRDVLRAWEAL